MLAGTPPGTGEKRANPRWPVRFPVLHGYGGKMLVGLAADLNDYGMAFVTRIPYAVDSILALELRLPSGRIRVKGIVRHCRTGMAGVQFLELSQQQRRELQDYCLGQAPRVPN